MQTFGINAALSFGLSALRENQNELQTILERLSTGKSINRASDDPSGMIAAEDHRAEIYALNKQLDSMGNKEGYFGAKEGGLSVVSEMLLDLESLALRASNEAGISDEERDAIGIEARSIIEGIDHIARNTTFKGQSVMQEFTLQGINDDLGGIGQTLLDDPGKALEIARDSRDRVSSTRAAIGSQLQQLDHERGVIGEQLINLNASLSSIEDIDYAAEAAKLVRAQIKEQASIAAIDISRSSAEQVLGLLENATQISNKGTRSGLISG